MRYKVPWALPHGRGSDNFTLSVVFFQCPQAAITGIVCHNGSDEPAIAWFVLRGHLITMSIVNIAGYQFVALQDLAALQQSLKACCLALELKGTILLSEEGTNQTLSGTPVAIEQYLAELQQYPFFQSLTFAKTYTKAPIFNKLLVKIKQEIITSKDLSLKPQPVSAKRIAAETLKQWLDDEHHDFTLLDTRNAFEFEMGSFDAAIHFNIQRFSQFDQAIDTLSEADRAKPMVIFCTGGIRCEKAALLLERKGFTHVYQLDGGILRYFDACGDAHFSGSCFVFDQRVQVSASNSR